MTKNQLYRYYYILATSHRTLLYRKEALSYYIKAISREEKPNDALMGFSTLLFEMYSIDQLDNIKDFFSKNYKFKNITYSLILYWYNKGYWKGTYMACKLFDSSDLTAKTFEQYTNIIKEAEINILKELS